MSAKTAAFGVQIKAGVAATPTNVVAGLKEVAFNGGERAMIDSTTHDNTVVKSKTPHPLRELRSLDVTLEYDPADTNHERMRAAHAGGTVEYQTLVLPDAGAAQWAMTGIITKFSLPTIGIDGMLECVYTFEATAAEAFTQ